MSNTKWRKLVGDCAEAVRMTFFSVLAAVAVVVVSVVIILGAEALFV